MSLLSLIWRIWGHSPITVLFKLLELGQLHWQSLIQERATTTLFTLLFEKYHGIFHSFIFHCDLWVILSSTKINWDEITHWMYSLIHGAWSMHNIVVS